LKSTRRAEKVRGIRRENATEWDWLGHLDLNEVSMGRLSFRRRKKGDFTSMVTGCFESP
jgi:hypothetical protein